jgi:spermidine synthase
MRTRTAPVAALLFASGFCALVYQTAWLREFRLIFGASTAASAAVLAIFIGGLGAGGLLLGSRADRHARPLLFYSMLEAIVAAAAALSPFLIALARSVYLASGGSMRLGLAAATIERLALSIVVLVVPTIAMGGTLPAAARAVTRNGDVRRQDLATLYGVNTLGAVAGCVLSTFLLLELYGTRRTLWLAAAINMLVAVAARAIERRAVDTRDATAARDRAERAAETHALPDLDPPVSAALAAPLPFLLVASGTVGFAFFLMELVWYRMLGPLLGGSVFTFGLVLAAALAGIGLGGLLYSAVADDRRASLSGFAASCLIEALTIAAAYALGDRIAILALAFVPLGVTGFGGAIAGWTIVATIVVVPPAVVAGYQFPLLIALFGEGREGVGRDVGLAYGANTAGAILGSLAGGFGALPWLSAPGAWRAVALVLVVLGIAAAVVSMRRERRHAFVPQLTLAAATIALLTATGPTSTWRHSGIGAGRAARDVLTTPNQLRAWEYSERRATVWDGDGVESSVALAEEQTGYAFVVNGKTDGSALGDAGTQVMLGLLGALSHPAPHRSMVIGLGTGSSAGWLASIPSMEHVDVVELEPLILEVARACRPVNQNVLENPNVRVTIGDAREMLLTTRDRYDIIASEPSNPFRAGIASLFTVEYYRAAADRLTDDGVFSQWVQGYEIDAPTLRTIYATLGAVFPQVETWQTKAGDLALLASKRRGGYRAAALRARIAEEPFRTALADAWRVVDLNGLLAHYVATDHLTRALAVMPGVDINTDDRNVVEFGLARSVGRPSSILVTELRVAARAMGAARPPLDGDASVSWPAVTTAWANFAGWNLPADMLRDLPPAEQTRQAALRRYFEGEDPAGARELWQRQTEPPRDPSELAMAADVEAEAGAETALPLIDKLRAYQPAEADTVLATLRLRQSRTAEAAAALGSALARYRVEPWPLVRYKQKALSLATAIAGTDPKTAPAIYDALREPFVVRAVDASRKVTQLEVAATFDFKARCREPIAALEPHVPWTARFLSMRRDCYALNSDPRTAAAARDLSEFIAREPAAIAPR